MKVISSAALPSPCPIPGREPLITRIGVVQTRWFEAADTHIEQLREGVSACAGAGANVVFLPELTLSRYPCLLYTSPSPRDVEESRMPSSA